MNRRLFKILRNSFILLATFGLPVILIVSFNKEIKFVENYLSQTGIAGPFISILVMGLLSVTPIPTDPIVILNGAIFGPTVGILVSWMGNNLAAFIEYFIGMGLRQVTDFDKKKQKLPFNLGKFPADSIWFLIFARFIPSFGGKLVSIAGGVYKVSLWRYTWTTLLSNIFGSILLALGGYSLLHTFVK